MCIPDRTTMSLTSRPFATNLAVILSRGSNGDGNCSFADFSLAVSPSNLPSETGQKGPPDCSTTQTNTYHSILNFHYPSIMKQIGSFTAK